MRSQPTSTWTKSVKVTIHTNVAATGSRNGMPIHKAVEQTLDAVRLAVSPTKKQKPVAPSLPAPSPSLGWLMRQSQEIDRLALHHVGDHLGVDIHIDSKLHKKGTFPFFRQSKKIASAADALSQRILR